MTTFQTSARPPVDLGHGVGCAKCCSRLCSCQERSPEPPFKWSPCDCPFCRTHRQETENIAKNAEGLGIEAAYRTNP